MTLLAEAAASERIEISIQGAVQGVGFRPFVYRLAGDLGLAGWVANTPEGVLIEAEGDGQRILTFLLRLQEEKPRHASIQNVRTRALPVDGATGFLILPSGQSGAATAEILPDLATCPECLSDILDPANRRYRYPFTNCTFCGPRFTIIEALPYDRRNTTMKEFSMCPRCREEYGDPADRRFHAQPTACPECGPQLSLWTAAGETADRRNDALLAAADALRRGMIVAVKGLGGFHLMADARNGEAVRRLRIRKQRDEKPFAVMFPDLAAVKGSCCVTDAEATLLASGAAPIVLVRRLPEAGVSAEAAPGNPMIGALLPYTPLHHLLMREVGFPVIATSGNRSEEPICIDERDALRRLAGVADVFLVHDRPIARHCDDSVARVAGGSVMLLRRARGFAPRPVHLGRSATRPLLAVGAHQKNTVALLAGRNAVVSQHIGDLGSPRAFDSFRRAVASLEELYPGAVEDIACDMHPGYLSTQYAREEGARVRPVQHHYAHVASCMAEHHLNGRVLGVAWDGTGYGTDATVWGGEFLLTGGGTYRRTASFRTFALPGGEKAVREPRRTAVGLLYELFGDALFDREDLLPVRAFSDAERHLLRQAVARTTFSPRTSSAGRLFDAVASILGICHQANFEGQAAMMLEHAAAAGDDLPSYPYGLSTAADGGCARVDWGPMIEAMLAEPGDSPAAVSARFHATLARIIVDIARREGEPRVVLTGGCFQNAVLLERTIRLLRAEGFQPFWHHLVPPNDGGIALGQLYACLLEDEAGNER
jgi:hydrogenase maturation protein HypF